MQGEQPMEEKITLTKEQFDSLLASRNTAGEGLTAEALAKAFATANRTENPQAPMKSVYNPKGETAHPRPRLRAKTRQNGVDLQEDTLTWEEIAAMNVLPPGVFRVTKGTGTTIPFTVTLTRGADEDSIEAVDFHFPCKDEHRYDHRPLLEYLFEVLESAGLDADVARLKALKREMDDLRKQIM
jgi:hypothetical protein